MVATTDTLRRFLFEKDEIRGSIVRLNATWQRLLAADNYPERVQSVLGEALAATALLGRNLKFDGHLTVQIQNGTHVRLLVLQCDNKLRMRGLARFGDELPDSFVDLVDGGALCITVESTGKAERYQSIVPLQDEDLAACLEHYYQQSVQLPTVFMLAADHEHAAGLMLQAMPEREGGNGRWGELLGQLQGLDVGKLSQVDEVVLLSALFPEDDIRLFDSEPVCFHCDCSVERIENMLHMLGPAELNELLLEPGPVEIRCEFCNELYVIPAERIRGFVAELNQAADSGLH